MNRKHTDEEREQSVLYYLESGKGMATISKELGIGVNTLNRWVRSYKKKHGIPDNSRRPATNEELQQKIKELERENKEKARQLALKEKELTNEQMKVDILKKSLHIFMEPDA